MPATVKISFRLLKPVLGIYYLGQVKKPSPPHVSISMMCLQESLEKNSVWVLMRQCVAFEDIMTNVCSSLNHEGCFAQLLQLALAAECCALDYDGCISCASQIAEKLNIKMVVCKIEKSSGMGA